MTPKAFLVSLGGIESAGLAIGNVNVNLVLNVVTVILLVVFAPRYLRVKDLQGQLGAKDSTIVTHVQSIDARDKRIVSLQADLDGAAERAEKVTERNRKLSEGLAQMQGRYEEQSRYTAREALITLERLLTHQGEEAERRHAEMMQALKQLAAP